MAAACRDLSADGIDILVVALQEIEMGTASVAVGAVKEVMGKKVAEQGNHNARWWGDEMSACLGQGCPLSGSGTHRHSWERVAMRQMSGLLLCVYSRRAMCSNVANTATGVVACGVGGFGGNKGAVAVSFSLFGQRVLVMNSHFAAHQVRPRQPIARGVPERTCLIIQPSMSSHVPSSRTLTRARLLCVALACWGTGPPRAVVPVWAHRLVCSAQRLHA